MATGSSSSLKMRMLLLPLLLLLLLPALTSAKKPNILILLVDDLGYGDVGAFGNTTIRTPNIDRLASEGLRLTHHLTAAPVCTPSRAALLTGKYPINVGMVPSNNAQVILFTASTSGLPPNETTFAKVAKQAGYATALIGKWHLGSHCGNTKDFCHHPNNHGFDYFYGSLMTLLKDYSEFDESVVSSNFPNMRRNWGLGLAAALVTCLLAGWLRLLPKRVCWLLAVAAVVIVGFTLSIPSFGVRLVNSQMHRQTQLVEQPIRFERLTQRLVWEGVDFIDRVGDKQPFLLFMSFLHVHTPLYNSVDGFRGRSRHGSYGDNVEEMDWSVGRILDALDKRGLTNDTIVYFSSDNGGHVEERTHLGERAGGFNGQYRGGKCQGSQDGGIRVPGLLRWPGVVPAGSHSDAMTSQMDLMPTLATVMQQPQPDGLDGRNLLALIRRPDQTKSPHEFLFQYCGRLLHAVRWNSERHGVLKLRLYSPKWLPGTEGCLYVCDCRDGHDSVRHSVPVLTNLTADPSESSPLSPESAEYRELSAVMLDAMRRHQQQLRPPPSEFTFEKLVWRPWLQDCCGIACNCRDDKYDGRDDE